jgi:hypothetical protein
MLSSSLLRRYSSIRSHRYRWISLNLSESQCRFSSPRFASPVSFFKVLDAPRAIAHAETLRGNQRNGIDVYRAGLIIAL